MKYAIAIALFYGSQLAGFAFVRTLADFSWQQWLGEVVLRTHRIPQALGPETFTAAGAPWVPQEWLFSTVFAIASQAHAFAVLAVLVAIAATLALILVALRSATRGASTIAVALTTLCASIATTQMFNVRAQVIVWPIFALFLLLLERRDRWMFAAIPLTAAWANLHASVLLAPTLAAIWTIGIAVDEGIRSARVVRGTLVTIGCALATLATPLTWRLPAYAIALIHSPIRQSIEEWQRPHITDTSFGLGVLPLIVAGIIALLLTRRSTWRDALLFATATGLATLAVRNTPIAAFIIAPIVARWITPFLSDESRVGLLLRERGVYAIAVVAMTIGAFADDWFIAQPAQAQTPLPTTAIARASTLPGTRHLYCEDFAWCSLALAHPTVRVFLDSRCDPYPDNVWHAYTSIQNTDASWRTSFASYGIDTVLARKHHRLERALRSQPGWHVLYTDTRYTLLART